MYLTIHHVLIKIVSETAMRIVGKFCVFVTTIFGFGVKSKLTSSFVEEVPTKLGFCVSICLARVRLTLLVSYASFLEGESRSLALKGEDADFVGRASMCDRPIGEK